MKWKEKFEKGTETWFMFMDFWNVVQNYWNVEDTDEYWDLFVQDCKFFINKYPKYFALKLIYAFIDEQERKRKGFPDNAVECLEQEEQLNTRVSKHFDSEF